MAQETEKSKSAGGGPELRLIDRRAFVGFPELKLAPGVVITDFALQIPDVTFPMNLSGGASKYQKRKLDFGFLEITVDAEVIHRQVSALGGKLGELDDLKLHFRPGYLEGQARLKSPERAAVTFKVAFDGDGERLAVYVYDVRMYAFAATPASRLPALMFQAVKDSLAESLPDPERRGANGFSTRLLPKLVEAAAVGRGFKMPSLDQARLAEAAVLSKGLRLRFAAGGLPPPSVPDEELLLALEGARAFADAEELLALGKLKEARSAYLKLGDANEAHPFAAERLLTLLVAEPGAHELALDVAASLARRRDKSATALWAEGVVRERRGEFARAAERYLALCALARRQQEEAGAFFAAEAAARAARDQAPQMAVKALHELLGLKPDHLPSLKALARASDQAKDRAGAIRAYRRLAALARDPADAADAHVQLARLCAQTEDDVAGARLHCEAALRLAPDHPDALLQLGQLCLASGEHLRAIKALDRLREVGLGRHEIDRVGRANLLAGQVWEEGLKQPENALLRYREAASLLPGDPEPLYKAARVAESLGRVQEAVAGYQQAIELAGPAPANDTARSSAHQAHHALARMFKSRLGEPLRAKDHLEAAFALDPSDLSALDELLPHFRATGRAAELADACEKAANAVVEPVRKAALWAEAGELLRGRLNQPERAEKLLVLAAEADPRNRIALEGLLAIAEARRDGGMLCRCLKSLAEITTEPKDRVAHLRRLAVAARDVSFDLELAAWAMTEVLKLEPDDLPTLGELCGLQRRRADMAGLAWALERRGIAAETHGDKRLAAAAYRELGSVLEARLGRTGEALVALEKAARLFPEVNALLDLANLSLRLERPQHARKALEDVLQMLPKHAAPEKVAEVRARLGKACDLLGDKEAARENYAAAFPLRRLDDELSERLESLLEEQGHRRELTDLWASRAQALIAAQRPKDAAPLFFKSANALLDAGDSTGAMLRLQACLDAAPQGEHAAQALETLAQLQLERGSSLEAAGLLQRRAALEQIPRAAARFLYRAAGLAKGTARELVLLEQSLQADASFVPARLRRAELVEQSDPRTALADLEAALTADLDQPDFKELVVDRDSLTRKTAFAALKANQLDSARRLFASFNARHPEDLDAALELVKLHRRAGALEPLVDLLAEVWPRLQGAGRSAARRELAEGALQLGRRDQAREALRSLLSEAPNDTWAAGQLLELLPSIDDTREERLELLSRLLEVEQGEAKVALLSRRAQLNRDARRFAEARADLTDAAQLAAEPLPYLRALAETAQATKDEPAELLAWKLALEKAGDRPGVQDEARDRLTSLARSRLAARDGGNATQAYALLTRLPLDPAGKFEAFYGLSQAARLNSDLVQAEEALGSAAKQGPAPKRVEALLERATLQENRRAREEAIESFEGALALAPRHRVALEGLKRNLRSLEDFEGLAEVLATEASQAPKSTAAPLFTELASLYLDKLGQAGPGEAALRKVALLEPQNAAVRRQLAGLVAKRNETDEAVKLLEEAATSSAPAEAAPLLREAARLARGSLDNEGALRLLRKAHALAPAKGEELAELAELLYLRGAVSEALPLQRAFAAELDAVDRPDDAARAWLRLADLAQTGGDLKTAEQALRKVHAERPSAEVVDRLADLVRGNNPAEAIALQAAYLETAVASPRAVERLVGLAREARQRLADAELPQKLYARAAELAQPEGADVVLAVRNERASFLREQGRGGELMGELLQIAQLRLESGDTSGALEAYREEADLAQQAGRIDEALKTLDAMAQLADEEGLAQDASGFHLKRAALLRDSKLDLEGANQSLERAWILDRQTSIAHEGIELARRRHDRESEIDWLERTLESIPGHDEKALAFVSLARLHLGLSAEGEGGVESAPMFAPEQAEAAIKQALQFSPGLKSAEQMLLGLYTRQERLADVAAYFEDAATRARELPERARLLLEAARVYQDQANRPQEAAAALLAARAALPDDIGLTTRVADQLHRLGRTQDAADFDALLLEGDPFHPAFDRHLDFLTQLSDEQGRAGLLSRRAEKEEGDVAALRWLQAADAFEAAGATERARLSEGQAFAAAPSSKPAFDRALERAKGDARATANVLSRRAHAVPEEAVELLSRRAQLLDEAGEKLLAAEAYDELLANKTDDPKVLLRRAELAFESKGALASQPYDRRLTQLAEQLPVPEQVRIWSRLGSAALESEAFKDAADAFETVRRLDPEGTAGATALTSLHEVYSRGDDKDGLYSVTLELAKRAEGEEALALYRQAANLFPGEPARAQQALEALFAARPADEDVYGRLASALTAKGRTGELLALHERYAGAVGGPAAAQAYLKAARIAQGELGDDARAQELRELAVRADPSSSEALREVADDARRRGDEALLIVTLRSLAQNAEPEDRAEIDLERATLLEKRGDLAGARELLEAICRGGPKSPGFTAALDQLEQMARRTDDAAALAWALEQRAMLESGEARVSRLLAAAKSHQASKNLDAADRVVREALELRATAEGLQLAVEVARALGDLERAATLLTQAAQVVKGGDRVRLLLDAVDAHHAAARDDAAAGVLEKLLKDHPYALSPDQQAERFASLGFHQRAMEVGFEAAMKAGDPQHALLLADAAKDAAKSTEALWALARKGEQLDSLDRLTAQLRAEGPEPLSRLAEVLSTVAPAHADALWLELLLEHAVPRALEELKSRGALNEVVKELLARKEGRSLELALPHAADLPPELRAELWTLTATKLPERRAELLGLLAALQEEQGQLAEAATTLERLAGAETDAKRRAQGLVKRAELLRQQNNTSDAQAALERALESDPDSAEALTQLARLLDFAFLQKGGTVLAERFVTTVERLQAVAGEQVTHAFRASLADAYQSLKKWKQALAVLEQLEETPERLKKRAEIATELGLTGEALSLRERIATEPAELEEILGGYLKADLVPFAVRLGEKQWQAGQLSKKALRLLAERLAPTVQGAQLAARVWPSVLRENVLDPDGWTLYSEALRGAGHEDEAQMADGFGAALTSSNAPAPAVKLKEVDMATFATGHEAPLGLKALTPETMPRIHQVLSAALESMGGGHYYLGLDPVGGPEAWLAGDTVVLGAGALGVFGPMELNFLMALALGLGADGEALRRPGKVPSFAGAAVLAFNACPSSLAAARVLAVLDDRVRGSDPTLVQTAEILTGSDAFQKVALRGLELGEQATLPQK